MDEKNKNEFRNAIRHVGYNSMKLENPYDRVRVSEWVRKLISISDDNLDDIKKKNEYIQLLRIQTMHSLLRPPFSKPPPDGNLPPLAELLGNLMNSKIPDLPRAGPISPAIIHKSPDGRAYISIKKIPGNGVLCYMAVTPDPNELDSVDSFCSN